MIILGLNAFHADSAACILRDGQLIAAAEEERFRRIKHWAGFPAMAIDYCLREAGCALRDVSHIALNQDSRANLKGKLAYLLSGKPGLALIANRLRNRSARAGVAELLARHFPGPAFAGVLHAVEHHVAHLHSAFHVLPFAAATTVSVDGFGDFASAAWGLGEADAVPVEGRVYFPHSLGLFYQALTQYLGFPHYGDEYKVMGLAPYGEPKYLEQMRELVRIQSDGTFRLNLPYFRHHTDNVSYSWNDCSPEVGTLYTDKLAQLLGRARSPGEPLEQKNKDLARSAQAMYEEAFFAILHALHARYPSPNLALSGGCAMNSVANGKVYLQTPFKKMYLPAAAGDAGGAIGAAAMVAAKLAGTIEGPSYSVRSRNMHSQSPTADLRSQTSDLRSSAIGAPRFSLGRPAPTLAGTVSVSNFSPYLGPSFSKDDCWRILEPRRKQLSDSSCQLSEISDEKTLCLRTARAIADGKVIGWFQGRMEWGPRALGNRSILCDPRRADMKAILNAKIKRRESFRPFAPSILRESVSEWFEQDDDVPYMMQVFQIREEKRALIPAVCHLDGSGRLQTVHRETNPLYHQLISAFCSLTSVPLVLNTSFNENEPVVCRPEEALDCFLRTKMDVLVLGNFYVERAAVVEGSGEENSEKFAHRT